MVCFDQAANRRRSEDHPARSWVVVEKKAMKWGRLSARGVTAFVLFYRCNEGWTSDRTLLGDAQRAMRLIRLA